MYHLPCLCADRGLCLYLTRPTDGEEVGADGGSGDSDDGMSCDGDAGGAGPAAADDSASDGEAGDAAETATVSEAPVDDDKYDRDMDMEEEEATLRRIKGRSLNHWKRYKTTELVWPYFQY